MHETKAEIPQRTSHVIDRYDCHTSFLLVWRRVNPPQTVVAMLVKPAPKLFSPSARKLSAAIILRAVLIESVVFTHITNSADIVLFRTAAAVHLVSIVVIAQVYQSTNM